MGWTGTGSYSRTHNFSADGSANIKILASRMDAEFNDFASAMTNTIARDGQNTPSSSLPMGGYRHTNVGAAQRPSEYLRAREYITDIPIYFEELSSGGSQVLRVSADYYVSVSAGQSPPEGARLKVLIGAAKNSVSADLFLFTPTNTSAGAQPHQARIVSRGNKYDPGALQVGTVHELVFNASASVWTLMNPYRSHRKLFDGVAKVKAANGVVCGIDPISCAVYFNRDGDFLRGAIQGSVSVSCSTSGAFVVISTNTFGASALTSGIVALGSQGYQVPVMVKDTVSSSWKAKILNGQLVYERMYNVDGTTVSANCTVKISPHTFLM